jgi:hypothetical protein
MVKGSSGSIQRFRHTALPGALQGTASLATTPAAPPRPTRAQSGSVAREAGPITVGLARPNTSKMLVLATTVAAARRSFVQLAHGNSRNRRSARQRR